MKNITFALLLFFLGSVAALAQDNSLKVMTFNIRYNTPRDSANAWPHRIEKVASQILFYHPQVVGVQEALSGQMDDLAQRLVGYKFIGTGRDDGARKGEFSAIFYDAERLTLLDQRTFWLSETPETVGSKGWDANLPRIVTYGRFRDKKTKKEFYHFNTHFDHIGKVARRESAKLLLKKVNEIAGKVPAVITGDFNATPTDEPIQVLVNPQDAQRFTDAKSISKTPHYGPTGTFNGFRAHETGTEPIDYIFLKGKWGVAKHATISESWKGLFASDHFAVLAELSYP